MVNSRLAYQTIKGMLSGAGVPDADFEAETLMRQATGHSRFMAEEVADDEWALLKGLARRRAKREPLQYILGSWPFLGIELLVGPGVLIPRPETEEVCLAAGALLAQRAQQGPPPVVLDLCSGSGALALGLQSFVPAARIMAVECSGDAMGWLQKNLGRYKTRQAYDAPGGEDGGEYRAPTALQADALTYYKQLEPDAVDMIVCNPPYVTEAEYAALAPELYAEPKLALVPPTPAGAADDGLLFYREISRGYRPVLRSGGWLVFEIGAGQGEAVRAILEGNGYAEVDVRRDLAGHPRIALARR